MGDVKVTHVNNISDVTIDRIEQIEEIKKIAPAAIHVKELNHIDPISVESLRIDQVRNLDPVSVDRLNVTHLPTVNLAMSRMPAMDINVRRLPPVAIGLHQDFCLPSEYTVHARFFGIEFLRFNIHGQTLLKPQDRVRREQVKAHERSFAEVAAVGNPAIPNTRIERRVESTTWTRDKRPVVNGLSGKVCARTDASGSTAPAPGTHGRVGLSAGGPHHRFSLGGGGEAASPRVTMQPTVSSVGSGR